MLTAARCATLLLWIGLVPILGGCAALSPLNGIPSNYFPDELRGETRSGKRTIDLSLLGQTPPDTHHLDTGDVLSVFIDGVLGRRDQVPPVYMPKDTDGTAPSFGYPVAVREDGTIRLPLGKPIPVRGLSVTQAEDAIRSAVREEELLSKSNPLLLVSLQRARQFNVLVIRQEQNQLAETTGGMGQLKLGNAKRGTGKVVTLKAYENDVLHALAETGGLPGLDAENTIYVIRRRVPGRPGSRGPADPNPGQPLAAAPLRSRSIEVRGQSPDSDTHDGHSSPPIPWDQLSQAEERALQNGSGVMHADGQGSPRTNVRHADFQPSAGHWTDGHSLAGANETISSPAPLTAAQPGLREGVQLPSYAPLVPTPAPWPSIANGDINDAQSFLAQRRMDSEVITIPVRLAEGQDPQITESDILLYDGDIVFIESRETEVFYTGGLLGGNQFALPRDYDIDVVRAIAIASGMNTPNNTGWSGRMGGVSSLNRDISVGASDVVVLRELSNGSQVPIKVDLNKALRNPHKYSVRIIPGDYVILQYKPLEAVGAFIERNLLAGGLIGVAASNVTTNSGR
jgi:hypothetical protein